MVQNPPKTSAISKQTRDCLNVWQQFLNKIPKQEKIPSPVWSMEFGASYPYENTTPHSSSLDSLRKCKGSHGSPLNTTDKKINLLGILPSYARTKEEKFPQWKVNFIRKNREFYARHKQWLDSWIPKIRKFPPSLQKLEWNCQGEESREIRKYLLQLRPSGLRVKRTTAAPSLVGHDLHSNTHNWLGGEVYDAKRM